MASKKISGTVTEQGLGDPLIGVKISVKGTDQSATTNLDGKYEIEVPNEEGILVFSYTGYKTQTKTVGEKTALDVALEMGVAEPEITLGGYSAYRDNITPEEMAVFKKALAEHVGAIFTPYAVASQFVSGVNYRFSCTSKGAYPGAIEKKVRIDIFQPLPNSGEPPKVMEIVDLTE